MPLKSVSSASTLLDGRKMILPLEWLLLCSWVITVSLAFISCSELRMEFSFLFGTKQVGFVSGHISVDGHKFCCYLPQIFGSYVIMNYMMCLEYCKHHQTNICTPHNRFKAHFPHFHQSDFTMENLNIQKPLAKVWRLDTWAHFNICTLLMVPW